MMRGVRLALWVSIGLWLGAGALGVASSEEQPKPATEEKTTLPLTLGDVSATAKRSTESGKAAQRLGLDLTSDAPLAIDARSAEMLDDGKGGESLRFRGAVKLTQGELTLTCDRLDAFFPEGRSEGRPQKVVATGDVHVEKGEFELNCTRATFEDASCIAVCLSSETCQSGKWPAEPARFRRGKNVVEGRELEFNQCTGKLFARCGARLNVAPREKTPPAAEQPTPESSAEPESSAPAAAEPAKPAVVKP